VSRLFRNVPIVNYLEMSPLLCRRRTFTLHSQSRDEGFGGKGRQLSPFPPLISVLNSTLRIAYVLLRAFLLSVFEDVLAFCLSLAFSKQNFALGSPQSNDGGVAEPYHPRSGPAVGHTTIHSEASLLATMGGGSSAFFDQVGFR